MPALTTEQSEKLKAIVLNYLQGEAIGVVKVRLETACADFDLSCKELYKSIPVSSSLMDDKFLIAILGSLNIKRNESEPGQYEKLLIKSKNVHELLTHLYHDGHHHVGYLLNLIDQTKPHRNWTTIFLLGTLISGGTGAFLYLKKEYIDTAIAWVNQTFPTVINWLSRTFSLLRNLSLVGILYNSLGLTYYWYNTFSNGTTSTSHKITNLIARTLATGLTITAYGLTYMAEGVLSWPISLLFVASACVDLIKSIWVHKQTRDRLLQLGPQPENECAWEEIAQHERAKNLCYRSLQTLWVKAGAAILTAIAVAVWNFFPPNLIITVSCFLVISLIAKTKETILAGIHENYVHRLQRSIQNIAAYPSPELTPASSHNIFKLKEKEKALNLLDQKLQAKEEELQDLAEKISLREEAIEDSLLAVAKGQNLGTILASLKSLRKGLPEEQTKSLLEKEQALLAKEKELQSLEEQLTLKEKTFSEILSALAKGKENSPEKSPDKSIIGLGGWRGFELETSPIQPLDDSVVKPPRGHKRSRSCPLFFSRSTVVSDPLSLSLNDVSSNKLSGVRGEPFLQDDEGIGQFSHLTSLIH